MVISSETLNSNSRKIIANIFFESSAPIRECIRDQGADIVSLPNRTLTIPEIPLDVAFKKKDRLIPVEVFGFENVVGIILCSESDKEPEVEYVSDYQGYVLYLTIEQLAELGEIGETQPTDTFATWLTTKKITTDIKEIEQQTEVLVLPEVLEIAAELSHEAQLYNVECFQLTSSSYENLNLQGIFVYLSEKPKRLLYEINENANQEAESCLVYIPSNNEREIPDIISDCQKWLRLNNYEEIPLVPAFSNQLDMWNNYGFFEQEIEENIPDPTEVRKLLEQAGINEICEVFVDLTGEIQLKFVNNIDPAYDGEPGPITILGLSNNNKLEKVEHVVGLFCCSDNLAGSDRKEIAKALGRQMRINHLTADSKYRRIRVMSVNNQLLDLWWDCLNRGEPFIWVDDIERDPARPWDDEKQPTVTETGQGKVESVEFFTYEPNGSQIGAQFMQLVITYEDGTKEVVTLDMGSKYQGFDWDGLTKPSFEMGMNAFSDVLIPLIPYLYRRSLELKSARYQGEPFFTPENFWALDLYNRLGKQDFTYLLQEVAPRLPVQSIIDEIAAEAERLEQYNHIGTLISHTHDDHDGFLGMLSSAIPQVYSSESWPFIQLKHFYKSGYLGSGGTIRRHRATVLSTGSRRKFTVPLSLTEPNETVKLGSGRVTVTTLPVDHSVYGAAFNYITINDNQDQPLLRILYTGDFRFSDSGLTEMSVNWIKDHGVDVVITDTTNVRPNASAKPSLRVTKEMMLDAYTNIIRNTDGLIFAQLAQNNVRDAAIFRQAMQAVNSDRQMIVDLRRASLFKFIEQNDRNRYMKGKKFPWSYYNPRPPLGEVGIYQSPRSTFRSLEKQLMEQYSSSVFSPADVNRMKDQFVMMIPPTPFLRQTMAHIQLGPDDAGARLHYWPYGSFDKSNFRKDWRFLNDKGVRNYYSDYKLGNGGNIYSVKQPTLRQSGHSTPEDFYHFIEDMREAGAEMIIPIHGETRRFVGQTIEEHLADQGINTDKLTVQKRFPKNDQGMTAIRLL